MKPLLEKGKLPTVASIIDAGAHGILTSASPLISPRIWTTIASGKEPEKHGVTGFYSVASEVRALRVWEILERQNWSIGLYHYLITWPPKEVDGFVIPGFLAGGPETYPPELQFINEIAIGERKWKRGSFGDYVRYAWSGARHGLKVPTLAKCAGIYFDKLMGRSDPHGSYFKKGVAQVAFDGDTFVHLLKRYRPRLGVIYFHATDPVSHFYWKYYDPESFDDVTPELASKYGGAIPLIYEEVDRALDKILKQVGTDTSVVIVSDHGFTAGEEDLRQMTRIKVEQLLADLDLKGRVGGINVGDATFLQIRDRTDAERTLKEVEEALQGVVTKEGGDHVLTASVHARGGDIYIAVRPNKDLELETIVRLKSRERKLRELFVDQGRWTGGHALDGVIMLSGPAIKKGFRLESASILDVAPTMLALGGVPVPRDMDGRVLTEAFDEEWSAEHAVEYIDTHEVDAAPEARVGDADRDEKLIEERLRALGYID
jgi:predicted AlkP superfamily phosphohydrolase/phosphomutase